jgi:hypothetical protein
MVRGKRSMLRVKLELLLSVEDASKNLSALWRKAFPGKAHRQLSRAHRFPIWAGFWIPFRYQL